MIEVPVQVKVNGVPLRLSVRAGSIRRAIEIVRTCYPRGDISVVFPIRPESFFSGKTGFQSERLALESSEVGGMKSGGEVLKCSRYLRLGKPWKPMKRHRSPVTFRTGQSSTRPPRI